MTCGVRITEHNARFLGPLVGEVTRTLAVGYSEVHEVLVPGQRIPGPATQGGGEGGELVGGEQRFEGVW